jgi:hypothetical protein
MCRWGLLVTLLLGQAAMAAEIGEDDHGFLLNERISGSASTLGLITKFDTSAGYQFNRFLAVEAGLPIYSVHPSSSFSQTSGMQAATGIGNVYADLRLSLENPVVNYTSLATVAAPTGDKATGFSTGHVTYDWSNLFDRSFGHVTPFVNLGIANTITDTPFFVRPFTSYGFVTHAEGGASYKLFRLVSVGTSAYAIEPSGQQTVVSKLIGRSGSGNSTRHHHGVFETSGVTVGDASIARDDGFSAWLSARPSRYATFLVGYSRSVEYALDSFFFGVNFNLSPLVRRHF